MPTFFKGRRSRVSAKPSSQAALPSSAPERPADPAPPAGGIEGFVDVIDGERVSGWAYDAGMPSRRLLIEISAGDTVELVLADMARDDVLNAGKGDGRYGFEARLDLLATGAATVHVRAAATGQELTGSPASTDFSELAARANNGVGLEYLKSEAQLALLSLQGSKKR